MYHLSLDFPDSNSVSETVELMRSNDDDVIIGTVIDVYIQIGTEEKTFTFEEFFEKLGFE